jgi:hypothetical protein
MIGIKEGSEKFGLRNTLNGKENMAHIISLLQEQIQIILVLI